MSTLSSPANPVDLVPLLQSLWSRIRPFASLSNNISSRRIEATEEELIFFIHRLFPIVASLANKMTKISSIPFNTSRVLAWVVGYARLYPSDEICCKILSLITDPSPSEISQFTLFPLDQIEYSDEILGDNHDQAPASATRFLTHGLFVIPPARSPSPFLPSDSLSKGTPMDLSSSSLPPSGTFPSIHLPTTPVSAVPSHLTQVGSGKSISSSAVGSTSSSSFSFRPDDSSPINSPTPSRAPGFSFQESATAGEEQPHPVTYDLINSLRPAKAGKRKNKPTSSSEQPGMLPPSELPSNSSWGQKRAGSPKMGEASSSKNIGSSSKRPRRASPPVPTSSSSVVNEILLDRRGRAATAAAGGRYQQDSHVGKIISRRESVPTTPGPLVPLPMSFQEGELVMLGAKPAPHPCLNCLASGPGFSCHYRGFGKACSGCVSARRGGLDGRYCTFVNSPDEQLFLSTTGASASIYSIPYLDSLVSQIQSDVETVHHLDYGKPTALLLFYNKSV